MWNKHRENQNHEPDRKDNNQLENVKAYIFLEQKIQLQKICKNRSMKASKLGCFWQTLKDTEK